MCVRYGAPVSAGRKLRVAYLTDHYPATSNTFVQREVRALRALGAEVHTFSTHRVGPEHVNSQDDRDAFATTHTLLPISPRTLAASQLRALVAAPSAYVATLAHAVRRGHGVRGRLWQLFYFAESVLLWHECSRRGLTHLHAHFTQPAADAALLLARLGRRAAPLEGWSWSFTAHGTDITETDQRTLAKKVEEASAVVCVSDYGRAQLMTLVPEKYWAKIRVVHCGIDLTRFPVVRRPHEAGARFRILTVGRLVAVKGQGLLIGAVAALVARGVDAELTIVGEGPRRAELEALALASGIADRVRLAGRVGQDDILQFYRSADVFALSSFAEGVPVVAMEAMATELPVVVPRVTGVPELVEDGRQGILVSPGRSDLLADALAELAGDPDRRARMGREGRRRVQEEFELGASARAMRDLLGPLADQPAEDGPTVRKPRAIATAST